MIVTRQGLLKQPCTTSQFHHVWTKQYLKENEIMKQRNVFLSVVLPAIIAMAVCLGCSSGTGGDPSLGNPGTPGQAGGLKLQTTRLKSLYLSNMQVQDSGSTRAADNLSNLKTLTYINAAGQNSPVYFSSAGKNVVLEVNSLQRIDDKRTLVNLSGYYEVSEKTASVNGQNVIAYVLGNKQYSSGNVLIDWSTDKIYDFNNQGTVLFTHGDNLFTGGIIYNSGTLYKINLNTMSAAVPLNNVTVFPIDQLYAPIVLNDKIISSKLFCFDVNAPLSSPPQVKLATVAINNNNHNVIFGTIDYNVALSLGINFERRGLLIQDLEGSYWYFNMHGMHEAYNSNTMYNGISNLGFYGEGGHYDEYGTWVADVDYTQEPYIVCKPTLDAAGQMSISEHTSGKLSFSTLGTDNYSGGSKFSIFFLDPGENGNAQMISSSNISNMYNTQSPLIYRNNGVFIFFEKGFVKIARKARGLQINSTALTLPTTKLNPYNCLINKDNYLYWLEGTAIKRLYLDAGQSEETIYTHPRIISSSSATEKILLTASGSNVIFYQGADDGISIYTYSLPMYRPGAQPQLMSTSDVGVRDIVELKF